MLITYQIIKIYFFVILLLLFNICLGHVVLVPNMSNIQGSGPRYIHFIRFPIIRVPPLRGIHKIIKKRELLIFHGNGIGNE